MATLGLEELDDGEGLEVDKASGRVLVRGVVGDGLAAGVEVDGACQGSGLFAAEDFEEGGNYGCHDVMQRVIKVLEVVLSGGIRSGIDEVALRYKVLEAAWVMVAFCRTPAGVALYPNVDRGLYKSLSHI